MGGVERSIVAEEITLAIHGGDVEVGAAIAFVVEPGSAHAVADCIVRAPQMSPDSIVIVNLSGRGDKDVAQAAEYLLK